MKHNFLLALATVFAMPVLAHEGHGNLPAENPLHYVMEPMHALLLVVILAAASFILHRIRRQKMRN